MFGSIVTTDRAIQAQVETTGLDFKIGLKLVNESLKALRYHAEGICALYHRASPAANDDGYPL